MMNPFKIALSAALLVTAVPAAFAGEASGDQYNFTLGGGVMFAPSYPGSDEVSASPFPIISVNRFYIPGIGQVIDSDGGVNGFKIYPSFGFDRGRDSSKHDELAGLDDIDWSLELGLGASYRQDWLSGFVEVRQGFNGFSGPVAELGLDVIANPTEDLEVMIGPRAAWGSEDYMDTYFGISADETGGAYATPYHADAGFNRVGLAASASYDLTDDFTFHLRGGWDRLIGDAADSPIVKAGSVNQFYGGAGISYDFGFSLD